MRLPCFCAERIIYEYCLKLGALLEIASWKRLCPKPLCSKGKKALTLKVNAWQIDLLLFSAHEF
jgi:hypothetical protein